MMYNYAYVLSSRNFDGSQTHILSILYYLFQCLEVNFDSDSVVKQYVPGTASTPKSSTSMSPSPSPAPHTSPDAQLSTCGQWMFEDKAADVKPGFQLVQVVFCSNHSSNSFSIGTNGKECAMSNCSGCLRRITISNMQYSIDMKLWVKYNVVYLHTYVRDIGILE